MKWNVYWFEQDVDEAPHEQIRIDLFIRLFYLIFSIDMYVYKNTVSVFDYDMNIPHIESEFFYNVAPFKDTRKMLVGVLAWTLFFCMTTKWLRITTPILFGYLYFTSMTDSYQHHYLLFLILLLLPFVNIETNVFWPIKLIKLQVAIVYFYTILCKLEYAYLTGEILRRQLLIPAIFDWIDWLVNNIGITDTICWSMIALTSIVVECYLMIGIIFIELCRSSYLRPWIWILGTVFHYGIHLTGFKIRAFSLYMITFYLLFLPKRITTLANRLL